MRPLSSHLPAAGQFDSSIKSTCLASILRPGPTESPQPPWSRPRRLGVVDQSERAAPLLSATAMAYSKCMQGRWLRLGGLDAGLCGDFTAPSAGDDSCSWHAYFRRGAQHGAEGCRSPRSPVRQGRRGRRRTPRPRSRRHRSARSACAVTPPTAAGLSLLSSPPIAAPSLASSLRPPLTKGRSMSSIACMRRAPGSQGFQQAGSRAAISRPNVQTAKNETDVGSGPGTPRNADLRRAAA